MSAPGARLWICGIGALLACAGCGFKGPLYLPERNATVVTHAAPGAQGAAPSQGQTTAPSAKSKNKTPPPQSPPPTPPPQSPPPSS